MNAEYLTMCHTPATFDVAFQIPPGLGFADLRLRLEDDGLIYFDWSAIERLCEASSLDPDLFKRLPLDQVGLLISTWYAVHLRNGGKPDPVQEMAMACSDSAHLAAGKYIHRPRIV
ncbi:hypothetical protein [Curvibacter lanceolatus]|uniref:hypothetical protein n=1 Tax=Curvibacter lanceolatus TaxID=86182 RepID=UPI0012F76FD1|nr:hypothetical protein [Curvibacter lanceolatus]